MHDKGYMMNERILLTNKDKKQFEQWLTALRSGEYNQSTGALQDSHGYCCLGVACKVTVDDELLLKRNGMLMGGMPCAQPNSPKWLYGVGRKVRHLFGVGLMMLNDDLLYDFNEIADILSFFYDNDMI